MQREHAIDQPPGRVLFKAAWKGSPISEACDPAVFRGEARQDF